MICLDPELKKHRMDHGHCSSALVFDHFWEESRRIDNPGCERIRTSDLRVINPIVQSLEPRQLIIRCTITSERTVGEIFGILQYSAKLDTGNWVLTDMNTTFGKITYCR